MEDVRRKGEEVQEISVGLDGDWFLRTDARHACKTVHDNKDMISNVELFAQLIAQAGLSLAQYAIQFFTFVPDPSGYVTVLHKTDGTLTRCIWHNVPKALDALLEREGPKGVHHVAVGVNGSYVVILNSGVIWWSGVHESLNRLLEEAERTRRGVVTVSLSLISPTWYFVEFADGATEFFLPPAWHETVNKFSAQAMRAKARAAASPTAGPRMATAFNVPRSRSPLPPQTGSFNPYGGAPPRYNPYAQVNPYYGFTPFASNPYLASVFAPPPAQPQVVNITHVYNQMQQPEKKSSLQNYNGLFTLLGGALKLAGTVLGPGMGTGFGPF
ncbi:hypothetical protein BC827DRAFT_622636 [Russula dissimulans]|nr:hypothetical protein BC827DRAFT_622636 [Russula dissimulans]